MKNKGKSIISKILNLVLVLVISLFTIGAEVMAAAPSSGTVSVKGNKITEYVLPGYGPQFAYKYMDGNKYVYCLNHKLDYPTGQTYTLSKELNAGVTYILANGYPNKSITGNKEKDYYITQIAIWWYLDDTTSSNNIGSYYKKNAASTTVGKTIYNLKEAAKKNNKYETPSLSLSVDSDNMTLNSDSTYYVSKEVSVNTTAVKDNYSVSLTNAPKGTIITDLSGNEKTSFKQGEKFIVKVPASVASLGDNSFTVKVSATGSVNKAYEYKTTNSKIQNVALTTLYPEETKLNESINLKYNKTEIITISKQDATNKEELPGATLVLKDENGKIVEEWVSGSKPHEIKNLADGKYTLTETIAPTGYVLSEETVEFEVKNGKVDEPVIMYNKREDKYISISKQDATNKEELPGATLVLKDENGNVVEEWISGSKPHEIKNLADGKYTLTETIAPTGYVLSEETVEFEVKNGKVENPVVMLNYPEVEVPKTASSVSIIVYIIGFGSMMFGSTLLYRRTKNN